MLSNPAKLAKESHLPLSKRVTYLKIQAVNFFFCFPYTGVTLVTGLDH